MGLLVEGIRTDRWYVTRSIGGRVGRRPVDDSNLWAYTRDLYQVPGVAGAVRMDPIKRHDYGGRRTVNPTGIVPKGPDIDFTAAHDRNGRGRGGRGQD
jgi:glutathionyl-hydroquinone reductase